MPRYTLWFLLSLSQLISSLVVIRIFGVFTHAQLGHRQFWDTFSQQLQHRGPDYIKRCTFQNKPRPLSAGISVILPAVFPPLEYQVQDIPCAATLVKDHEEDIKNVSEVAGWCFKSD